MPLSEIKEIGRKHWWKHFVSRDLTPNARIGHVSHHTNAGTGNLIVQIDLWRVPHRVGAACVSTTTGIVPFSIPPTLITLFHNSRDTGSGPFGSSWSWPLDESITEEGGTGNCVHRDGSGAEYFYTKSGSLYISPAGMPTLLTKVGSTFYLLDKHAHPLRAFNSAGKLTDITDANQNHYRINRNVSHEITSVVNVRSDNTEVTLLDDFAYTSGKLTQFGLKAAGVKFLFTYTSGNLTTITLPDGTSTIGLAYSGTKISSVTDMRGKTTSFAYDGSSRPTTITNSMSPAKTLIFTWDDVSSPKKVTVEDERGTGFNWVYERNNDTNYHITKFTDAEGKVHQWAWDTTNNLQTSYTNPRTFTQSFTWNTSQLALTRSTDFNTPAKNTDYTYGSDSIGNVYRTSVTDPLPRKTIYTVDGAFNVTAVTSPGNHTTRYTRNRAGDLIKTTDAEGWVNEFEYDEDHGVLLASHCLLVVTPLKPGVLTDPGGLIASASAPPLAAVPLRTSTLTSPATAAASAVTTKILTTTFSYNVAFTQVTRVTSPDGQPSETVYDSLERPTSSIRYLGAQPVTTKTEYDANGNATKITDAMGNSASNTFDNLNRLTASTNADGKTTSYGYDDVGNMTLTTDADTKVWVRTYFKNNWLKEVKDPMATPDVTTYAYDAAGNITSITNPRTKVTTFTYDNNNNRLTTTTPITSQTTTWTYDDANQMASVTDPNGNKTTFEYDADGRLTKSIAPYQSITQRTYYANGLPKSTTDPNGHATTNVYDTAGRLIAVIDTMGVAARSEYSDGGQLIASTDRNGNTTRFEYDSLGREVAVISPDGTSRTENILDLNGRLVSVSVNGVIAFQRTYSPAGLLLHEDRFATSIDGVRSIHTTKFTYNNRGLLTRVDHPNGSYDTNTYDDAGRRTQNKRDAGGLAITTDWTYDANSNVLTIARTDGGTTTNTYDDGDRLITVALPVGNAINYEYDLNNNLTKTKYQTTPEIAETSTYDGLNRRITFTDRLGRVTRYLYDAAGNLISTYLPSAEERHTLYDALNRPIQLIYVPASGGTADTANTQNTFMTYDANGNRLSVTNNNNETTAFKFDSSNRLIQTILPTGESSYKSYDGQGLVSSETDYNGNTTFYTYDEQGHIIQVAYPDGSNVKYYWCCCQICKYVDATGTSNLAYDALHRLSSMSYSSGKTVTYEYNGLGLVTKITDPDGNYISYSYNSVGGCTSMVTSADSQTTTITYDALRRRSTVTYPTTTNVVTTYTYDALDRITKISSVSGATTYDLEYTYVTNKDILSQQVIKLNGATVSTIDLTYDSTGRVTEEKVTKTGPTVTYDKQYTYDKVGRRLTVKDVTNGNWLETSTSDASGRLTRITVTSGTGSNPFSWPKGTTNVTCDANGNITQLVGRNVDTGAIWKVAHQFDYEQRVTLILLNNGDTVQNIYDGMGYRLREATVAGGATTTKNLVSILGNRVIQERDGSDTVTARYYWDGGVFFKKDHSTSSKYFVPEIANSPFTGWNNAGTFNRYDLWDTFGVLEDQSAAGSLSPFQLFANMLVDSSHLTTSPNNSVSYPELGQDTQGFFSLKFASSPGGRCGPCTITKQGMICPDPECMCPDCMMPLCAICTPEMEKTQGRCCRRRLKEYDYSKCNALPTAVECQNCCGKLADEAGRRYTNDCMKRLCPIGLVVCALSCLIIGAWCIACLILVCPLLWETCHSGGGMERSRVFGECVEFCPEK